MPNARKANIKSANTDGRLQRMLLATFCLLFMTAGALCRWFPVFNEGSGVFASGTLFKVGVVLGVAWLAAPQLERFGWQRLRGSLLVGLIIIIVLWAIRPKIGAIAAALFIGGSVFFGLIGWFRNLTKPPGG